MSEHDLDELEAALRWHRHACRVAAGWLAAGAGGLVGAGVLAYLAWRIWG